MAKKPIVTLKEYFKTGKKPTENQFADLLDSYLHLDSLSVDIGWEELKLIDPVQNYYNEHQIARIKRKNKVVYIEGMLSSAVYSPFVSFILPEDYRPKQILTFGCISKDGAKFVQISPSGEVLIDFSGTDWLSLSGITYLLD